MHLKDILKKKTTSESQEPPAVDRPKAEPGFTIVRSDSQTEEVLEAPSDRQAQPARSLLAPTSVAPADSLNPGNQKENAPRTSRWRSSSTLSRRPRGSSMVEERMLGSPASTPSKERRLSAIFNRRSISVRSSRSGSPGLPEELENIEDQGRTPEDAEAQWEKRATVLAQGTNQLELPPTSPKYVLPMPNIDGMETQPAHSVSDQKSDDDIQTAIKLHEAGNLHQSTLMFGRLADPEGSNNALSQVLYGLALRHGWGVSPNPPLAVTYLSLAARNSATIESAALDSGMKKGGAAKGELVLAIYELANCYREGLGVDKDHVAARRYFETAARLGDIDAMEETARCYEDGIGGKKDKFRAARYYRLAEEGGRKIVGNSWIWKPKYDPKAGS